MIGVGGVGVGITGQMARGIVGVGNRPDGDLASHRGDLQGAGRRPGRVVSPGRCGWGTLHAFATHSRQKKSQNANRSR